MKLFFRNWSLLTLSNVIFHGCNFISLIIIARIISPSNYGTFTVIITVVKIAQTFSSFGLQNVVIRLIARENNLVSAIAKNLIKPLITVNVFAIALLIYYLYRIESIFEPAYIILASVYLLSFSLWNYCEPLAFGLQNMKPTALLNSISAVILVLALFLIPTASWSFNSLLFVYIFINLAKSIFYLFSIINLGYFETKKNQYYHKTFFTKILSESFPIYLTSLFTLPLTQLPIIFLSLNSTREEVGYLGISLKMSLPLSLITHNLFTAIYPELANLFTSNKFLFYSYIKKIFTLVFWLGAIFTFTLSIFSTEIVLIVLGENYRNSIPTLTVQAWNSLNYILHSFLGIIFIASDNEKLMVKLSFLNSLLIGSANYFGSMNNAETLSIYAWIAFLIGFSYHWYFINRAISIEWKRRFLILASVTFIAFSMISYIVLDYSFIIRVPIYLLGLILMVTFLKISSDEDLKSFWKNIQALFKKKSTVG